MDGVTQALLGAVVGQASVGPKLGRRAAWWGALGGMLPDADIIVSAPFGEFTSMWMHRGTSHSLWFGPVVGPLLGVLVWRFERWRVKRKEPGVDLEAPTQGVNYTSQAARSAWMWLFALALITHPMLDVFTSYGTQLFAPFWRARFAFDGVGIIDPVYSLILIVALLIGSARRDQPSSAARIGRIALGLSSAYLLLGLALTERVKSQAREQLEAAGYPVDSIKGYTSVFQNGLKRVVATSNGQVLVGYGSGWNPSPIEWRTFERRPSPDAERVLATEQGQLFAWFADGQLNWTPYLGPTHQPRLVEIDDIRYGMPGNPEHGFWGIEAELNAAGEVGSVRRMRRERAVKDGQIADIFRAAFGTDPRTFRVGVGGGFVPLSETAQGKAP